MLAALQPGVRFLGGRAVLTRCWVSGLRARVCGREWVMVGPWPRGLWARCRCGCGVGCGPVVAVVSVVGCGLGLYWAVAA